MNPYEAFVNEFAQIVRRNKNLPLGGLPMPPRRKLSADAPQALIFAPHPDDEVIIGGFPLRLLRQAGYRISNVAVTQGSNKARQAERWQELTACCQHIGFELIQTRPGGFEGINLQTRQADSRQWAASVERIAQIIHEKNPRVIFFPHDRDSNSSHIGTHHLV